MGKNNQPISEEKVNEILMLSDLGYSSIKISNEVGISKRTVLKYLHIHGKASKTEREKFLEKKDGIVSSFLDGSSINSIAKSYNTKHEQIVKLLKEEGISLRQARRLYDYDDHIFDIIDNEEKAYWFGFICADGSIIDSKGYLCRLDIGLASIDHSHLEKFVDFISGDRKMIRADKQKSIISVNSKIMCEDLNRLGAVPRKSLVLKFPRINTFQSDLYRHFIRGYFDGDGSITLRNRYGSIKPSISFVGTLDFINGLQYTLNRLIGIDDYVVLYQHGTNTYEYKREGSKAMMILDFMYDNSNIYLDRKHNKYIAALSSNR